MNGKNKVKQISEDGLHLIPSLSSSVKTQIMGGKDCLRCKGKTLLGIVNKLGEDDGIEFRLHFKIFSTLN